MATAPAKKKTAAPNPLDDLDDAGLEALPDAALPGPSPAGGESGLAPEAEIPAVPMEPPAPMLRLVIRGLCGLLVLASVVIYFLNPAAPRTASQFDPASTVIVSLVQGPSYGQAIVHLGDGPVGDPLADEDSLKQALAAALGDTAKTRLLIKASGGVQQREVDRVGRIVLLTVPAERKIEIHVAPLESTP